MSKETSTTVSKETYYSVKRDLLQCQKRPTTVSKETYYSEAKAGQGTTTKNIKQNKKMKRTRQLIFRKKKKEEEEEEEETRGRKNRGCLMEILSNDMEILSFET